MESGPLRPEWRPAQTSEPARATGKVAPDNDWFQDLVDQSRDLLCVHDLQGRLLAINPTPARLLGYTVEEILRIPMRELLVPEYRSQFDAYLEEIQKTGVARGVLTVMSRSGERRTWQYHNTLRTEGVSSPVVRGIAHDVTEQKQAERELRAREADFRLLLEQASDGIFVSDAEGRYLRVNQAGAELLGYSVEEVLKLGIADVVAAHEIPRIRDEIERLFAGAVVRGEWQFRRKDGSLFPGEVAARQLPDGPLQAILRDVTERKLAETAIETIIQRVRGESSDAFFSSMAYCLAECLSADHALIGEFVEGECAAVKTIGICSHGEIANNFVYTLAGTPCEQVAEQGTCCYSSGVADAFPGDALLREMKIEAYVGTSLFGSHGQPVGIMAALYSRPLQNPGLAEMILNLFSARTAAEIERKHAEDALRCLSVRLSELNHELQQAKERLAEECHYLEEEIHTELGFGEIVGKDGGLKEVLAQVKRVASSEATVLLLGETGTGKEVMARAVHEPSRRKNQPFIKMNCAAIPTGLLESELFGHEKGAFTGAVSRKVGRLELADKGPSFWTRLGRFRWSCNQNCCVFYRTRSSNDWEGIRL
jgi:PAS domain S-box-containing protein